MAEQLPQEQESFNFEASPLKDAYVLLAAKTPFELFHAYDDIDQTLMKTYGWDYANPELSINKVKEILESAPSDQLTEEEKKWRQEILWFWYHHAISSAIWLHKDPAKAKEFSEKALAYKSEENPNRITQLLAFLVNDQLSDAETWVENMPDATDDERVEKQTAIETIAEYKEDKFF